MTTDQHTAPSASPPDPANENIRYRKPTTAAILQDLARDLKPSELRVALYLATEADLSPDHTVRASSRQIATSTGMALSKTIPAIKGLVARKLISQRQGNTTTASVYLISFLETAHMPATQRGAPPTRQSSQNGSSLLPFGEHPVYPNGEHPATEKGAASNGNSATCNARAPLDKKYDENRVLDRVLSAKPSDHPKEQLERARAWLHGYSVKLGRDPHRHPPQDVMCAQFLTIAEWPALQRTLEKLFEQRIPPGDNDAWYISTTLNRIHGIAPLTVKQRRAELKLVRPSQHEPEQTGLQFAQDLTRELASTAKALR